MKYKFLNIFFISIFILSIGLVIVLETNKKPIENLDAQKFANEYKELNEQENANGKKYPSVEIEDDNLFMYATEEEILNTLEKETGVIYFGFNNCPWCRNIVPVLDKISKNYDLDKIYYYNIYDIRSKFSFDANNVLVKNDGTEFYYKLLERLDKYLEEYKLIDNNKKEISSGEKRIYAPTVIFVKEGTIKKVVVGTVDSQTDPYVPLDDKQKEELAIKYQEGYDLLADVCDEKC